MQEEGTAHRQDSAVAPGDNVPDRVSFRDFSSAAFWAGVSTFIFMVFGALTLQISVIDRFDLSPAQAGSWITITWLSAGIVSLLFIAVYRQPIGIGWTIPGLVYLGSLAGQFTFREVVAADLVAGIAILLLGVAGIGSRVLKIVPMPILMGMFAASILDFVTRMVDATRDDVAVVAAMLLVYLAGRRLDNPRIPPVGLSVVVGAVLILALGRLGTSPVELDPPQLAIPGFTFTLDAILTISLPMTVLVLGLGNVQGLGYMVSQGYRVPATAVTIAVGATTVLNAVLGGHPATMTRVSSAMLAGPSAGPLKGRYWAAIVAFIPATLVAFTTGLLVALIAVLPPPYVFTVAGLAILSSFEGALVQAFGGPLRFGAVVAFGVTLSSLTIAGIPSAFWAMPAGLVASLVVEQDELFKLWRGEE